MNKNQDNPEKTWHTASLPNSEAEIYSAPAIEIIAIEIGQNILLGASDDYEKTPW